MHAHTAKTLLANQDAMFLLEDWYRCAGISGISVHLT